MVPAFPSFVGTKTTMRQRFSSQHSFTPNLFQRISRPGASFASVEDSIQEEVLQLLRHAARSGRSSVVGEQHSHHSVMNYGMPAASFGVSSLSDPDAVIRHLKKMIPVFEPRIDPRSLHVTASVSDNQKFRQSILFDISASGKALSGGYMSFRVAVDFSNGAVHLVRRPNL